MAMYLLVHSPLVGPMTWGTVATELRGRGHVALVPDARPSCGDAVEVGRLVADHLGRADPPPASGSELIVVVHSGAGVAAPAIVAAVARPVAAVVFVDAQLPRPGRPAGDEFVEFLRSMARPDGLLPPFPDWWGDEALAELLPDPTVRAAFAAECRPVRFASYVAAGPVVTGGPGAPCGYVRLSAAYDTQLAEARALGWRSEVLALHHLALLTHPEAVAAAIQAVVA